MSRRSPARLVVLATAGVALVLASCSGDPSRVTNPVSTASGAAGSTEPDETSPAMTATPGTAATSSATPTAPPSRPSRPVTIAFAGDVHFESFLAARLDDPRTAMGPLTRALARADLSILNLETAVTTRGTPEPKEYAFRAPPVVFTALKRAGVDVVTMANNHALDYGPVSVPDALAAANAAAMPVIGIGTNAAEAYQPWIVTVHGRRIAFFAATAVVDSHLVASWSATSRQPGLATALDGNNAALVAAVREVRRRVDTVVVDMHYGSDLMACPTDIQREVASDLVRAGADVVVGQHAHVLLGGGYLGSAYVDFGLGNFQFYASPGTPTAATGVLVLTVDGQRITSPEWIPGHIVNGLPVRLSGADASEAIASKGALRECAGLTARPKSTPR